MPETATAAPPALTLQRPWGWAIIHAAKDIENRTWPTKHRGPLFIHQGKTLDRDAEWFPPLRAAIDKLADDKLAAVGAVLGWVTLAGCHQAAPGCCGSEWALPGQWHWMLTDPHPLTEPVVAKGALGLWRPDPTVLDAIRDAT